MYIQIYEIIEAINNLGNRDWFDYLTLALTIITILVSIGATIINIRLVNKNTNKQIENQNKETYRPRLKLNEIKIVEHNINQRYLYAYSKKYDKEENSIDVYVDITLENIGYGIANDITFYMLNNGDKCFGIQSISKENNQVLNSTIEIPKENKDTIKFLFSFNRNSINDDLNDFDNDDFIILICNYKDLNGNNYEMLIGFILKKYEPFNIEEDENENYKIYNNGKYNFYYYQEETKEFKGMINKDIYKENYKKIQIDLKL